MKIKVFVTSFFCFFCLNLFIQNDDYEYNSYVEKRWVSFSDINVPTLNSNTYNDLEINKNNSDFSIKDYLEAKQKIKETIIQKKYLIENKVNIDIWYSPSNYENDFLNTKKSNVLKTLLYSNVFNAKKINLDIEISKDDFQVRWNYKDDIIRIFWVNNLNDEEFVSVFVHELGHYFDMNQFKSWFFQDNSNTFYDICWNSTKVIKNDCWVADFVSGYAMTNKYEDFAESFLFYVFFNTDFEKKAQTSQKLKERYTFLNENIFKNSEFKNTSFKQNQSLENYYWDITKIKINLEKVLEYFKSWI